MNDEKDAKRMLTDILGALDHTLQEMDTEESMKTHEEKFIDGFKSGKRSVKDLRNKNINERTIEQYWKSLIEQVQLDPKEEPNRFGLGIGRLFGFLEHYPIYILNNYDIFQKFTHVIGVLEGKKGFNYNVIKTRLERALNKKTLGDTEKDRLNTLLRH